MEVLLERSGRVSAVRRVHYLRHKLDVPEGITRLRAVLRYRKERLCQLFLSAFGPGGYRGTRMDPAAIGEVVLEFELGGAGAGPGGPRGPDRGRALAGADRRGAHRPGDRLRAEGRGRA